MPPSAIYFYWVTRSAVIAFVLTGLLAATAFGARFLLQEIHRRIERRRR